MDAMSSKPPKSLDALRDLLNAMQAGSHPTRLGRRSLQVLANLVDGPDQAAVSSISQIAEAMAVNPSTLTRLAQRLGYGGFGELQDVFRRHVAGAGHFYSGQAGRLLQGEGRAEDHPHLAQTVVEEELANISGMIKGVNLAALDQAAGLLATAPRVRTHGLRQFYSITCFVSYALGMLRSDVAILGDSQHGIAHGLAQLEEGDVLFVAGSYPYTRGTVAAARIAASRSIPIIALTDSSASPLAVSATHAFLAPTGGSFFSNSMASYLVFAEALLTLVAARLGDTALTALQSREDLLRELNIEL